ncbi:MAG: OmpP1/FadL family transporter [Gammaproteobacteria bacterium]
MSRKRSWRRLLSGLMIFLVPGAHAHAGGPAFTRLFAPADTAQTSYLNPAGMTRLDGSEFAGQLIYGTRFSSFNVDDSVTTNTGGDPRDEDGVFVPSFYFVRPVFNDDWRLGLTLNAPGGFGASNGPNWAGRYYSDQFSLIFIAATATLARRVTPWLSVGGGLSYQYSSTESQTQVVNADPGDPDAKLDVDAEGGDFGYVASALVDLSSRTRFGVTWHSETDPDESTNVDLKRSTLPDPVVDAIEAAGNNTNASLRTPQHIDLGLYHEWENGWSASADAIWVDFSRFGLTELRVAGDELDVPDSKFKDFWIVTTGVEYPLADNLKGRLGLLYFEQPVANEDRTFAFALDDAWGIGGGVHYTRGNGSRIDFNATMIRTDDAPIDTGPASALDERGRVAGKNGSSPWALAVEFTYHWSRRRR